MKVALLISGYLRTFKSNLNNLQKKVINKFDKVDVYIHLTIDEELSDRYLNIHNVDDDVKFIKENLNPICFICESNLPISPDKKENGILNSWLKYFKLNQIKKCNEGVFGKYDLVIKYRPDLHIFSDNLDIPDTLGNFVYIPQDAKIDIKKLKNINDKYICDILSYGNSIMMDKYFNIYLKIQQLIQRYGNVSETLLYKYLETSKIKYKLVDINYGVILSSCNIFAICGDSGSGKTTLANILKQYFSNSFLLECDRYHKWERGDDNWKNFTHLNPDANYLSKIKEDVFNLKLGNSIYQVDYDHGSGKFTGVEEIKPSNNIIICGLHSLYGDNEHIYDFKIFMDTDIKLKNKWKVDRDVGERGYKPNAVVDQINKRQEDFTKFIYPQRDKSDMIINFFIDDITEKLSLKLFINNKYKTCNIIEKLNKYHIKYSINENDKFVCFIFDEYQSNELWKNTPTHNLNNFYNYIIFFIFNLKLTT